MSIHNKYVQSVFQSWEATAMSAAEAARAAYPSLPAGAVVPFPHVTQALPPPAGAGWHDPNLSGAGFFAASAVLQAASVKAFNVATSAVHVTVPQWELVPKFATTLVHALAALSMNF